MSAPLQPHSGFRGLFASRAMSVGALLAVAACVQPTSTSTATSAGSATTTAAVNGRAAPSTPVAVVLHGVRVDDPYRNLENLDDPATRAWLEDQGTRAATQLGRIPGQKAMADRIEALSRATGDNVRQITRMPGDRIFFLRRKVGESQLKLVLRVGLEGADRVLVDPEALARATGVPHAINYFVPSWDGRMLAYGVSAGGSEDASLRVMDVASGKELGEPIARAGEGVPHWAPDNRHLVYAQMRQRAAGAPETEKYLDSTAFVIEAGRPETTARPVFGRLVDLALKLDRLDFGEVFFAPGSRYMIARTTDTTAREGKLFVAPVSALGSDAVPWRQISAFADKITDAQLRGDTLYLRTYDRAPRGRVLALNLADPVLAKAEEVIAEPDAGVLNAFTLGKERLYAEIQAGFNTRLREYTASDRQGRDIAPAVAGSMFITDDPADAYAEPWVVTSAWTEPSRVLAVPATGPVRDTGLRRVVRPPGTPELEVSEVLVPSWDGAEVPLAIIHRKGLVLDGTNPTLLVGYGAYGFSFEAFFDPTSYAWFEHGGVLAYANVRGSGAKGDAWYRAGFKATKPNTWKDGIASARYLIDRKFASPKTLGIWGTSAGGIFVGRAVTAAPELFAAAIFDVGVMDTVRFETTANGITNVSEFGTATSAAEFPGLLEMSPYHHIAAGTAYPAVLLIHGMNDPRVDVWHSAKAAARLQASSISGKPILLRLDGQAGHGVGSTIEQARSKQADIYSFLLWQFGKT
jgi:prolyl oligopeptidase